MKLSEQIDSDRWLRIDGELKQLRPLVALLESENERLWKFHSLVLSYWMTPGGPSDKEMYCAIASLATCNPFENII